MARPLKSGVDYFPLDVNIDDKIELLEAKFGLEGFAILIKLWQKTYKHSYYIEWNEDICLLFKRKIDSDINLINSVVNECLHRSLFNKGLYEKYAILTSSGIQERYFKICEGAKRKNVKVIKEYLLINLENFKLTTSLMELTPEETIVNSVESTQSIVKDNILNNKNNDQLDVFFDKIWKLYPNKIAKGKVSKTQRKKLLKIGIEEMTRATERYIKDKEDWKAWQQGSTFFNTSYIDYLDGNYEKPKPIINKQTKGHEVNYDERDPDLDYLRSLENKMSTEIEKKNKNIGG